jgi:hypothetical protein
MKKQKAKVPSRFVKGVTDAVKSTLDGNEKAIAREVTSRFEPFITEEIKHTLCRKKKPFYINLIKLFVPAVLTWLIIQSVAAAKHYESRWVNVIAVTATFAVFAVTWYVVIDRSWSNMCTR